MKGRNPTEDRLPTNKACMRFQSDKVELSFSSGGMSTSLCRPLSTSQAVSSTRDTCALVCSLTSECPDILIPAPNVEPDPASRKDTVAGLRKIQLGVGLAYEIKISFKESDGHMVMATGSPQVLPPEIQKVIDKHSVGDGPLRGSIPDNTHAVKYSCKIDLKDNAKPVYVRQYRLTPLEKAELVKQVDSFIKKGWIEPSVSPWSSSVLFIPKPNGKLRFCVDYRGLNERSEPNRGPGLPTKANSSTPYKVILCSLHWTWQVVITS